MGISKIWLSGSIPCQLTKCFQPEQKWKDQDKWKKIYGKMWCLVVRCLKFVIVFGLAFLKWSLEKFIFVFFSLLISGKNKNTFNCLWFQSEISPFGHLRVNLTQSFGNTSGRWSAGRSAGGGTCLQITRGLQPLAVVFLHSHINSCPHARLLRQRTAKLTPQTFLLQNT